MARKFPGIDLPRIIDPTGIENPAMLPEVVRRNLMAIDQNLRELLRRGNDSDLTDEELETLTLQLEQSVADAEVAIAAAVALIAALTDELEALEAVVDNLLPIDLADDNDREGILDHDHGGTGLEEADFAGEAGKALIVNATEDGLELGQAGGRDGIPTDQALKVDADITLSSTTWAAVHADLVVALSAKAGDVLRFGVNFILSGAGTRSAAFHPASMNGASVIRNWADGLTGENNSNFGCSGWRSIVGLSEQVTGDVTHTVQADEVIAGVVTVALRYKVDAGSGNRTMFASATLPALIYLENLGTGIGDVDLGNVTQGSSFPPTPATDDHHFHTTHKLWFVYDGTRWLSESVVDHHLVLNTGAVSATTAYYSVNPAFGHLGLWVETCTIYSENKAATPGTNNFTYQLQKFDGVTLTSIGPTPTASSSGDAVDTAVSRRITIGVEVASTVEAFRFLATRVASGSSVFAATFRGRLIGV